jgi:predicted dehydrogenase
VTGVQAGVVGVGSMGRNHARVYAELPGVDLVGVTDVDAERARAVAEEYDTVAMDRRSLLARADIVSVAVPTAHHYDVTRDCIEAGVHALVEKPFVTSVAEGEQLAALAEEHDVVVQVGHVERFNPAVGALFDIVDDLDLVAVDAQRLGPPPDRPIDDGVVLDLMIHDIDIVLALHGGEVSSIRALSTRDGQYATAQLGFDDGFIATLTASRRTQKKVRTLSVTAADRYITVDYIGQAIRIHRHSRPEYTSDDSAVRFRDEQVIEQPIISSGEPLKHELSSFVEAATAGREPVVGIDDALRAVEVASEVVMNLDNQQSMEVSLE